jgi:hypothetical protein
MFETLVTYHTRMNLLSGVCFEMAPQLIRALEFLPAILPSANECLIFLVIVTLDLHVAAQAVFCTRMRHLSRVCFEMLLQAELGQELLPTILPTARVWFESLVPADVTS